MASNPYVNRVEFGGQTLMDVSDTTATAADVAAGKTFYASSGAKSVGTATHSVSYVAIGSVLMHAGSTAPSGYLVCDGTTYNIADYEELAQFFAENYGANNYWGGDGETTFAIPDWQGEFFRAAGTNSRENQGSGAAVGVHQNATTIVHKVQVIRDNDFRECFYVEDGMSGVIRGNNSDSQIIAASVRQYNVSAAKVALLNNSDVYSTTRPTNTSLLVCIKAKMVDNMSAIVAAVTTELSSKFDPVGKVIYYAGATAPTNYLTCDGTVYDIESYPKLAQFFADNYGAANYWGGDGEGTFAVPDWQGEFFRASGTNSRENQGSGEAVGVHQNGTYVPKPLVRETASTNQVGYYGTNGTEQYNNGGNFDGIGRFGTDVSLLNTSATKGGTTSTFNVYTSRPTNTSLLVCIKAV